MVGKGTSENYAVRLPYGSAVYPSRASSRTPKSPGGGGGQMTKTPTCFVRRLFLQSRLARRYLPSYSSVLACSHTTKYLPSTPHLPPSTSTVDARIQPNPHLRSFGRSDPSYTTYVSVLRTHLTLLSLPRPQPPTPSQESLHLQTHRWVMPCHAMPYHTHDPNNSHVPFSLRWACIVR